MAKPLPLAVDLGRHYRDTIKDLAPQLAKDVFGDVPIDHKELKGEAAKEFIRTAWQDPKERMRLLHQYAPPRRDGIPDPEGAKTFLRLVLDAHGWEAGQITDYLKQVESEGNA